MAYQHPQEMQYSQHQPHAPQHMPNPRPEMQQYQTPIQQPFPSPQAQQHRPPPPMRLIDKTIYNAQTNQPLYAYTISKDPQSGIPDSLLNLEHVPTGTLVGNTHRGNPEGPSNCFGQCSCNCCSPDCMEDVISVGPQGAKASIADVGTGRTAWGWRTTWSGGAEEWMFVKGGAVEESSLVGKGGRLVLMDAVSNGREVLRVEEGGEIRFGERGMALSESMVGEIMLVMASISIKREESKWSWLWELLTW